jgi:hypothetical protein
MDVPLYSPFQINKAHLYFLSGVRPLSLETREKQ